MSFGIGRPFCVWSDERRRWVSLWLVGHSRRRRFCARKEWPGCFLKDEHGTILTISCDWSAVMFVTLSSSFVCLYAFYFLSCVIYILYLLYFSVSQPLLKNKVRPDILAQFWQRGETCCFSYTSRYAHNRCPGARQHVDRLTFSFRKDTSEITRSITNSKRAVQLFRVPQKKRMELRLSKYVSFSF